MVSEDPKAIAERVAKIEAKARALVMLYNSDTWDRCEESPRNSYYAIETDESDAVCETNSEHYADFIPKLHNDCRAILLELFPAMWDETRAQRLLEIEGHRPCV